MYNYLLWCAVVVGFIGIRFDLQPQAEVSLLKDISFQLVVFCLPGIYTWSDIGEMVKYIEF